MKIPSILSVCYMKTRRGPGSLMNKSRLTDKALGFSHLESYYEVSLCYFSWAFRIPRLGLAANTKLMMVASRKREGDDVWRRI